MLNINKLWVIKWLILIGGIKIGLLMLTWEFVVNLYKRERHQASRRYSGATSALGGSQCTVMRRRRRVIQAAQYKHIHAYLILTKETVPLGKYFSFIFYLLLVFFFFYLSIDVYNHFLRSEFWSQRSLIFDWSSSLPFFFLLCTTTNT